MATSKTGGNSSQGAGGAGKQTKAAGGSKAGAAGAGDARATTTGTTTGETGAGTGRSRATGGASKTATGAKKAAAGGATKKAATTSAAAKGKSGTGNGKAAGAARKSTTGGAKGRSGGDKLQKDLREFVQAHPGGWGHNEWIGLVNLLRDRGHDTSDTDAIGMALERERLKLVLERVPGLGAQRVNAIADRYPRLWNLMQANADEIATVASLPKAVAEKVREAVH